jgi:double-stranded uracil-DNA glycosylase
MFSHMEQSVADLAGPDLRVLFCGINPGTLSGDLGLHFARPGNRFWKLLCAGGFTESVLLPAEQHTLPGFGIGITNLVGRVTVAASELSVAELREGATQLEAKVVMLRPRCVAVLGLQAYRTAFRRPEAVIGRQPQLLGGALLWLLPNPSGLQAHYQLPEMSEMFKSLFVATEVGAEGHGRPVAPAHGVGSRHDLARNEEALGPGEPHAVAR